MCSSYITWYDGRGMWPYGLVAEGCGHLEWQRGVAIWFSGRGAWLYGLVAGGVAIY